MEQEIVTETVDGEEGNDDDQNGTAKTKKKMKHEVSEDGDVEMASEVKKKKANAED